MVIKRNTKKIIKNTKKKNKTNKLLAEISIHHIIFHFHGVSWFSKNGWIYDD